MHNPRVSLHHTSPAISSIVFDVGPDGGQFPVCIHRHRLNTFAFQGNAIHHEGDRFPAPVVHNSHADFLDLLYLMRPRFITDPLPSITLFLLVITGENILLFSSFKCKGTSKPVGKWPLSCQAPCTILPIKLFCS